MLNIELNNLQMLEDWMVTNHFHAERKLRFCPKMHVSLLWCYLVLHVFSPDKPVQLFNLIIIIYFFKVASLHLPIYFNIDPFFLGTYFNLNIYFLGTLILI